MNMAQYILRRLLLMVPTLLGITLVCFAVINLAPGGPVEQKIQKLRFGGAAKSASSRTFGLSARTEHGVSREVLEALKKQYGFDKPVHIRYWTWLKNAATLNFGDSFTYGVPAIDVIRERFPVSMQFGAASFALVYLISIGLGMMMAWYEGRAPDSAISFLLIVASSIPSFILAIVLLLLFSGGAFLDIFPIAYLHSDNYHQLSFWGKVQDRLHHFILPLICYLIGAFTGMALLCRNSVLDEIRKDYIRTARAKGLSDFKVYFKHALRNGLIPLTTGIGGILAIFLSGSLLIETIFQLNGIGLLGYQAVLGRDYNVIMALIFISSILMLIGNLIGDLVYVLVDPRIDYQ